MSKYEYEKLRESIEGIKRQAAERETREISSRLKEQQERLDEERRNKEYLRRCEELWPDAKSSILGIFHEVNREVLGSRAKIKPWTRVSIKHNHIGTGTPGVALGIGGGGHYDFRYEATMEVAELDISGVGKIVVSRELRSKSTPLTGHRKPVIDSENSGVVFINFCGSEEVICKHCFSSGGHYGEAKEVGIENQPELFSDEARQIVSADLVTLMQDRYKK